MKKYLFILLFLLIPNISSAGWIDSLVAYYPFDRRDVPNGAPTTFKNRYGAGADGIRSNSPVMIAGRIGQAYSYNGTNQASRAVINLSGTNKVTIAFWLKWDAYANDDDLALEYTANYNNRKGILVDPNASGSNQFYTAMSAASAQYNGGYFTRPSAGVWHYYVLTFDRTTGTALGTQAWVDGVKQSITQNKANNMASSNFDNSTLYIMNRTLSTLYGAGSMDELMVFTTVLSDDDAYSLYRRALRRPIL